MTQLFRKQLIIAILPVLLLAALSTLWTTRVSERHMIAQLERELLVESELHAAGVRAFLDERIAELQTIAASPVMRTGDHDQVLPYLVLETERLSHHFEGLYLNDLQGNVRGPRGEEFNISNRDYFPRLLRGEIIVSDEIVSLATGQPVVLLIVPVFDHAGQQRGALGASIKITTLVQRMEKVVPPEHGFASLVDSQGTIIAPKKSGTLQRREDFATWLAERPKPLGETAPSSSKLPIAEKVRLADVEFFIAHRPVPNCGWHFYLAKREGLAAEPATTLRWTNLAFSGLVLVIAFLVAYYFTGRLLVPLAELVDVHRRFGQGDYQARIGKLPDDELGELGDAFNRTAEQLSERLAAQKAAERQLRESEARLRLLSENVDDAVFLHDLEGKIYDINNAACKSLGYGYDDLMAASMYAIVASPGEKELQQVWRTIVQRQEKVRRLEIMHRRRDGSAFPAEMSAVPINTGHGVRILCSVRDLSERRKAEDQMANFFRLSEDMMCIADDQGVLRRLSPAFSQVLGYEMGEMLGRSYFEFIHPDDLQRTHEEAAKIFAGRGSKNFENRYRCKDGTYKWLQWRPFREIYEGMIYAIARDVTESHRMTRLMQQTSRAAKIGGWEFDLITGKLFWTEETYRLHDVSPESYVLDGDTAMEMYTPESKALFLQTVDRAMQEGNSWSLELELITARQRRIWVHVVGSVDIDNGKPVRLYGSFQDITERKTAEEERRLIDDQLREMQRVESIGILAGGIAHDFNNLLTGVLGFTRLAEAEPEARASETLSSHLHQIEECSLRAADLCKQLLAYAGKGHFTIETIDMSQLVRETSALVESIVGSNAKLELDLDNHLPLIEGDATQLRQVVMNLVTNAFDALGQKPGAVRVRTGVREFTQAMLQAARAVGDLPPGEHVFVEVSDAGVGMSEDTVARIFDPFFTTKFAGRGLGLAAVQGIVRTHHGAILVQSAPQQGTTFTIVLPQAQDPDAIEGEAKQARQKRGHSSRAASGGTVLLIDDEASVLSLASTGIERGGFKAITALDGPTGIALFEKHRAEIVAAIVDITMPGMNGVEVLRELRKLSPTVPLLSMSGYTEKSLDAAAAELQLSGFVEKPFRLGDLVTAVQGALLRHD